MSGKKKLYIGIVAAAAAVLIGLIVWAICLNVNNGAGDSQTNEPHSNTAETAAQEETDAAGSTIAEADTQTEDTNAEATENTNTQTTEQESAGSAGNHSGGNEPDSTEENGSDETQDITPTKKPTEPASTEPAIPDVYPYNVSYKEYLDMTEDEQIAFYKQFKNHNEFKKWRTAAKEEYENNKIELEIGKDGKIDLSPITGNN